MIELKHVAVVCTTLKKFKDHMSIHRHPDNKTLCSESGRVILECKLGSGDIREIHYHAIVHPSDLYKLRGIRNIEFTYYGDVIKSNPDLYAKCEFIKPIFNG